MKCGIDPSCNASNINLSPEAREFLNAHNAHRSKHCTPELKWSNKLAADAYNYAKGCKYEHANVKDKSMKDGESLSAWWGQTKSPQDVVDGWYDEISVYNFDAPRCCDPPDSPKVGHFTQVVWRNTTEVGCAIVTCPAPAPDNSNVSWQYAVCRYSPPGNFNVNQPGELSANVPRVAPRPCVARVGTCMNACHSPSARPEFQTPIDLGGIFVKPDAVHAGCRGGMMMTALGRCACPEGTSWQSRLCAPSAAFTPLPADQPSVVLPAKEKPGLPDTTQVQACPAERPNGVAPNCCPLYTVFSGGVCVRTSQTPRSDTDKVQVRACPPERPIGTPPNCCPQGTAFDGKVCMRDAPMQVPKTGGDVGTSGTDKVQARACPSERPVGSWPNCCPSSTSFVDGKCLRKAETQTQQQQPQHQPTVCPPTRPVGTYPNCCPAGTIYTNGACVGGGISTSREPPADGKPLPKDTGPLIEPGTKVGPILRKVCPPDRPVGTYPNCCPKGTTYVNGACAGGGFNTSREPPPRDPTKGKVEQVPKSPDVNKSDILTRPSGNFGDVLKKQCPPGTQLNNKGQCEDVFRAPR